MIEPTEQPIDQPTEKTKRGKRPKSPHPELAEAGSVAVERLALTESQFIGLWRLLTGDTLVVEADPALYHVSLAVLVGQLPTLLEKL